MKDVKQIAASLRAAADVIENMPECLYCYPSLSMYFSKGSDFAEAVKVLGGEREKKADDSHMRVKRLFGELEVQISVERKEVCRQVTRLKEVTEWECDPILSEIPSK